MRNSVLVAATLLALGASIALAGPVDVLATARKIGADLKDWKYGHDESKHEIDCVQFVVRVVRELAPSLPPAARSRILINDVGESELAGLVEKEDAKIRGIQTALVEAKLGQVVARDQVRPGDFVQYWYRSKDGKSWLGHAAIVVEVKDGRFVLYSAHESHGKIDELTATFGPTVKPFFVRFTGADRP